MLSIFQEINLQNGQVDYFQHLSWTATYTKLVHKRLIMGIRGLKSK